MLRYFGRGLTSNQIRYQIDPIIKRANELREAQNEAMLPRGNQKQSGGASSSKGKYSYISDSIIRCFSNWSPIKHDANTCLAPKKPVEKSAFEIAPKDDPTSMWFGKKEELSSEEDFGMKLAKPKKRKSKDVDAKRVKAQKGNLKVVEATAADEGDWEDEEEVVESVEKETGKGDKVESSDDTADKESEVSEEE